MIKCLFTNAKAVVIGYGMTGRAVSEFLVSCGALVRIYDDKVDQPIQVMPSVWLSCVDRSFEDTVKAADLVVVSPGVPLAHPVFSLASEPISELELAYRCSKIPMIAITGTNGKTTVTTLVTEMLSQGGLRARSVGNIGTPIIASLAEDLDYFVVEASSFQLATTVEFHPRVALWTNFSPDHLDWHQGITHYRASKSKIFDNQVRGDTAVINGLDSVVSSASIPPEVDVVSFGLGSFDFGISPDRAALSYRGRKYLEISSLKRTLPHDLENALAGSAAAHAVGVPLSTIARVLRDFEGLEHRVEFVRRVEGIDYYNDSKATTPASVVAAMNGFDSVVLIAGGKNKGLDLTSLGSVAPKLKALVAIGEAADELLAIFSEHTHLPRVKAGSMKEAVDLARRNASPGDIVLLSPGCTSFDWYSSYAERGRDYKTAVGSIMVKRGEQ